MRKTKMNPGLPLFFKCAACGAVLLIDDYGDTPYGIEVEVDPCEACIEKAKEDGYQRSIDDI